MEEANKFSLYSEINQLPDDIKKEVMAQIEKGDISFLALKKEEIERIVASQRERDSKDNKYRQKARKEFANFLKGISGGLRDDFKGDSQVIFTWREKCILAAFLKLHQAGYITNPVPNKITVINEKREYSGESGDSFENQDYICICESRRPFSSVVMKLSFYCVDGISSGQGIDWIYISIPIYEFNQKEKNFVFEGVSVYFLDKSSSPLIKSANNSVNESDREEPYAKYFSYDGAWVVNDWHLDESWKQFELDFNIIEALKRGDVFSIIRGLQNNFCINDLKYFFEKCEIKFKQETPCMVFYRERHPS